ncbi:MAG TPA: hypothetical protein VIM33_05485 [Gaiellaceae bacterium]|jgi:hypothetical protein
MKKWKRYRSLRRLVVAFAAVAVVVPVGQARAQAATAQAAKSVYGISAQSYRHLPADDQQALRPVRSVATGSLSPSAPIGGNSPAAPAKTDPVRASTPVVFDSSATSSWSDMGIWAGSGLMLISFAALGGLLLARRSRMGQPAV